MYGENSEVAFKCHLNQLIQVNFPPLNQLIQVDSVDQASADNMGKDAKECPDLTSNVVLADSLCSLWAHQSVCNRMFPAARKTEKVSPSTPRT